ncbi:MAG: hypothetical protein QM761_13570 [Pseudoxanthomonas sp.]
MAVSEPNHGTQWICLLGGILFFLFGGSKIIVWLTTGNLVWRWRGMIYAGWPAFFLCGALFLLGLGMIVSAGRNLNLFR